MVSCFLMQPRLISTGSSYMIYALPDVDKFLIRLSATNEK